MPPENAIDAVTHRDPAEYYDALATGAVTWDDSLGMWVASRADDVRAVLDHPAARVRPLDAPVPPTLAGTAAGDVFARLVRMHDGDDRDLVKDAITNALDGLDHDRVAEAVRTSATCVAETDEHTGGFVDRWIVDVPLGAVADLIGIDHVDRSDAVAAGRTVASCFGPDPPDDAAIRCAHAVETLSRLTAAAATNRDGLAAEIRRTLPEDRADDASANTIGLLFQTADATAGLCANTLVRLARLARRHESQSDDLASVVADVSRDEPAVHTTRRWFAAPADVGGVTIGSGDAVLVVLAAANRDPSAGGSLSFGSGAHRCPAADLAPRIAALTVAALIAERPGVVGGIRQSGFRSLPNARIPTFAPAR